MNTLETQEKTCTSFAGIKMIASGDLKHVAQMTKKAIDSGEKEFVLIFDDTTAQPIEIDFRGTAKDVLSRLGDSAPTEVKHAEQTRGPGRPKLGVVAREVTLLPRHWDWLNSQPGGASVALRKLVDEARHANADKDTIRQSQEAAYRFMSAMAGNLPGFEESTRALFAGDKAKFKDLTEDWPGDVRSYAQKLAAAALSQRS
ncbi:MAG: DUF2239 domain-containing protein [Candidatus Melainabacteria bacterium]|nr:MAG: DUF2239 domain-containing protein [Candidatus Melainabacteria bacterium]